MMKKLALLLAFFAITNTVNAQTFYSRTPATTGPLDSAIFNVGLVEQEYLDTCVANGATGVGFTLTQFDPSFSQISSPEVTFSESLIYDWEFGVDGFNAQQVSLDCSTGGTVSQGSWLSLEFDNFNVLFSTMLPVVPPSGGNQTWGSAGMFGTTSMLAAVTAGVQDTAAPLWPLFALIGVPVAFFLAGKTRDFIMAAGAEQRRREKYTTDLANEPNVQKQWDLTEKYRKGE